MKTINVNLKENSYPVFITDSYDEFFDAYFKLCGCKKAFIIIDVNVQDMFESMLIQFQSKGITISKYVIEHGERSKNLAVVNDIYKQCLACGIDRSSCIIGIGGGVTGDIAGFVAATYMRGINLIHIPTTLLAQVDSSIGGKNGVDFDETKNIIGTIYQPQFVFTNVSVLYSLPQRQYLSGLAEVIKYGLAFDKKIVKYLEKTAYNILFAESHQLIDIIYSCTKIKAEIVSKDQYDKNLRMALNFGHTIGHAIESACNFKMTHGESIAIGMIIEAEISSQLNICKPEISSQVYHIIRNSNLSAEYNGINIDKIIEFINRDKKKIGDDVNFTAIKKIGCVGMVKIKADNLIKIIKNIFIEK